MGAYGNGLRVDQVFMMEKERIKHALKGELVCGETEDGFVYAGADRKLCERFILSAFDNVVSDCLNAYAAGRVYDRIIDEMINDKGMIFRSFIRMMEEECDRDCDYEYEDT